MGPPAPPASTLEQRNLAAVGFDALAGWPDDRIAEAAAALRGSCAKIIEMPPDSPIGRDRLGGVAADWTAICHALDRLPVGDDTAARAFFQTEFQPYRSAPEVAGLFTGYCQLEVRGSFKKSDRYSVPIYGRPPDLVTADLALFEPNLQGERLWGRLDGSKLVPYFTRAEIEAGALQGRTPRILWLDDAIDTHILQIQGSGRVLLDTGGVARLAFDGTNGCPFVDLGQILVAAHKISPTDVTIGAARSWLRAHPTEAPALMAKNPRYVFFRFVANDEVAGAERVVLTDGRSMAVDPRFVPLGVPVYIDTTGPDGAPLRRLMIAQDTGEAIKGPVRGDIYWGSGAGAFDKAARMRNPGAAYLLLPRRRSTLHTLVASTGTQ